MEKGGKKGIDGGEEERKSRERENREWEEEEGWQGKSGGEREDDGERLVLWHVNPYWVI